MTNEYVKYNSKENPHWGKQPREYYFNEIKSWREDLDTDYNIDILPFDQSDAPSKICIDHSNPKIIPGANNNFKYPQDGKDVIIQGLERLQGIRPSQPIINPNPEPEDPGYEEPSNPEPYEEPEPEPSDGPESEDIPPEEEPSYDPEYDPDYEP